MKNPKASGHTDHWSVGALLATVFLFLTAWNVLANLEMASLPTSATFLGEVVASEQDGTLRVGMGIPVQLDPAFASSDVEIAILNAVYDYLVEIDAENNIQPRLATDWEISQDGLTYTFNLAPNVVLCAGMEIP